MRKLNNKGFTLIELIATIVILSIVITIGAVTVTKLLNDAKDRDYELLIKEIKNAVEEYYLECKYSKTDRITCPESDSEGYYHISLQTLVDNGYLKGNSTVESKDETHGNFQIVNPKYNEPIGEDCFIRYKYNEETKSIIIEETISNSDYCPENY